MHLRQAWLKGLSRLRVAVFVALLLVMSTPSDATRYFDGVPLPADMARGEGGIASPWTGAWVGAWGGDLKHILVVERIMADGTADVIYAIGAYPAFGIVPEWSRHKASVTGDTLVVTSEGFTAHYERRADYVKALYTRGTTRAQARLAKSEGPLVKVAPTDDRVIDGVPLPSNAVLATDGIASPWTGSWVGAWAGFFKHILVVERVTSAGTAEVIHALDANAFMGTNPEWARYTASISGDTLTVAANGVTSRYQMTATGAVDAVRMRGDVRSTARMTKVDGLLGGNPPRVAWTPAISEMLLTDLVEGGKPVRLETVFFRPAGNGPFPLAVINHGSTGNGSEPRLFRETSTTYALALYLNARGYLVAFPQRRGRGKSDGLYDEGFKPDRRGYSSDPTATFAGFDRAMVDLHAAIRALRARPDVAPGRILLGGQSRGGILSVAYAGAYPDDVSGVLNFVGGWTNGRDKDAVLVNGKLFGRGVAFPRQMLWLYGSNDPFYDLAHTRDLHARFVTAGGQAQFLSFERPPGSGHYIINDDSLWGASAETYLAALPR
jgi:dienelactone hydrolase